VPLQPYAQVRHMLSSKLVDLLAVGEAFEDIIFARMAHFPRPGEELRVPAFTTTVGGGAMITSVAAARLGLRVTALSGVGEFGAALLRREGVKLVNVREAHEPHAVSVALSTRRDRSFVTFEGVNRHIEPRLLKTLATIRRFPRHVHFALSPRKCRAWIPVLRNLRDIGTTTSWDFGWNDRVATDRALLRLIAEVDWLFINQQEDRLYTGARARARRVVLKQGARGSTLYADGARVRLSAARADVLDTTGAGDAFNGGFIAGLLRAADLTHALRLANYIGARATERLGGIGGLPSRSELPAWASRIVEAA
jgi:sugar/nucleoside kinase (ribokinase family)